MVKVVGSRPLRNSYCTVFRRTRTKVELYFIRRLNLVVVPSILFHTKAFDVGGSFTGDKSHRVAPLSVI